MIDILWLCGEMHKHMHPDAVDHPAYLWLHLDDWGVTRWNCLPLSTALRHSPYMGYLESYVFSRFCSVIPCVL